MSYKFNLDHTLAIADIHDMITIDIKPETRCSVSGGDVAIHGYLTFRGSYLTPDLGEAPFEGNIPLDITLPYLGGAPDVHPEIISFDYRVANKESLTLNLEVALNGYYVNEPSEKVMDAWVDPVVEEPTYEEAVIEPFDFSVTAPIEAVVPSSVDLPPTTETVLATTEDRRLEVVEEELELPVEAVEDEVETIPYSPLVEVENRAVEIEDIQFEASVPEIAVEEAVMEEVVPVVEVPETRVTPKVSDSAAALMEELFAMKRGTAFKEKEAVQEEVVIEIEDLSEVEEVEVEIVERPLVTADSIAGQFADGETTIKMVYVGHESETLGGVLERYTATLDDVWNLSELDAGVEVGDCVMLRYEKSI